MRHIRFRAAAAIAALLLLYAGIPAMAQSFPARPVRLVIPTAPGGASDVMAREIARKLGDIWNQQVMVDNRPGGGVVIGTDIVAKAPADGHTLLFTYTDHIFYPSLHPRLPYDAIEDFAAITTIGTVPLLIVVHPKLPATSVAELVSLLKAAPGKYTFGSAGSGSSLHLAGELFKAMSGTDMLHVPYKGSGPAFVDMLAGQIDVLFPTVVSSASHVRSKAVRPLAVTSARRVPQVPDLPTVSEAGVPGYAASIWYAMLAPKGTPQPILDKLAADVTAAVNAPEVRGKLEGQGVIIQTSTPQELSALMKAELQRWSTVIRSAGIQLQ